MNEIDRHQDSGKDQINVPLLHQLEVDLKEASPEGIFESFAGSTRPSRSSSSLLLVLVLLRVDRLIHNFC